MIFALVLFICAFVFFAFFIGKNLSNLCNFWFFKTFEQVPVTVLVLIVFALGIAFSILIFIIAKIKQTADLDIEAKINHKNERENKKRARLEKKEQTLKDSRRSLAVTKHSDDKKEKKESVTGSK